MQRVFFSTLVKANIIIFRIRGLIRSSDGNIYEPRHEKTNILVSDTNQAVQAQKMARGLKFRI